jgi:uncharacterized protein (TIGR03435 family)
LSCEIISGNHPVLPRTSIATLATLLRADAGRLVVDKTGAEGFFDIELSFSSPVPTAATPGAAANPDDPPELFTALREQLGLALEPSRAQVDVVVIDHIKRPTEN